MDQPKKDKSRILYDAVSKDYNLGTYEEFKTKLQDDVKRQAFYNGVGKEYNLGTYAEFENKLSGVLKKKVGGDATSSDTSSVSGQEAENGSVATPQDTKPNLVKDIDVGKYDDRIDELQAENQEAGAEQQNFITNLLERKNNSTQITDSDVAEIQSTIQDEQQGDFGFFGNIKNKVVTTPYLGAIPNPFFNPSKAGNTQKEIEVRQQLAEQQNIKPNDVDPTLVKQTVAQQREEELLKERQEAKTEEFIETLTEDEQNSLKNYFSIKKGTLSNKVASHLLNIEEKGKRIEAIDAQLKTIESDYNPEQEYPEEYYQNNQQLLEERNALLSAFNKDITEFGNTEEDLLSTEEELDLFKRNYNKWDNFTGKMGIAGEDLVYNFSYLMNKVSGINPLVPDDMVNAAENQIIKEKQALEAERDTFRKGKSVSKITTWEDATEWAMDLVAEQTPNTILMATSGGASLPLMGTTAAGGKLYGLEEEERQGLADYTNFEKYGAAFLTGTAEALSEKISLGQINKAKRVFSTVAKNELKENTLKYLKKQFPDYIKDLTEEGTSEALAQFAENLTDKFLLGKDVNLTEGLDEAFISGAFMSGLVYKAPGIAKAVVNTVTPKDVNQKIGENFEGVLKINEQLKNNILPATKDKLEAKKEALLKENKAMVDKTIGQVDKLSSKDKGELLAIENETYKLRKEAQTINEDNIDQDTKKTLLADIKDNIDRLSEKKEAILSNNNQTNETNNNAVSEEIAPKSEPNNQINAESEKTTQETPEQPVETTTSETKVKPEEVGVEDTPAPTVELNPENTNEIPVEINPKNLKIFRGTIDKKNKNGFYALKNEDALNYAEGNEDNVISASIKDDAVVLKMVNKTEVESDEDFNDDEIEKFINIIGSKNVDQQDPSDITEVLWGEPKNIKKLKKAGIDIVIGNTIDGVSVYVVNDKSIDTNETTPTKNTEPNGNVQPGVDPSVQQGEGNQVQNTNDPATDKGTVTITQGNYTIEPSPSGLVVKNNKGKEVSAPTKRKELRKYAETFDFTKGKTHKPQQGQTALESDAEIAQKSNNPSELAEVALRTKTKEFIEGNADTRTIDIIEKIKGRVKRGSKNDTYTGIKGAFLDYVGRDKESEVINQNNASTYLNTNGEPIDSLAKEISEDLGYEVTEQDIVDIVTEYPNGINDVKKQVRDIYSNPAMERFSEITGFPASDYYLEKAVDQAIKKEQLSQEVDNYLLTLTDAELLALEQQKKDYEKEIQNTPDQRTKSVSKATNTKDGKKTSGVREKDDSPDGGKKGEVDNIPRTVRELAATDPTIGYLSGAVLSSLKKGESIVINNKIYNVTTHTKKTLRLKDEKGLNYSYKIFNNNYVGEGRSANLSRDIDSDVTTDLINENNVFHEKTDSFKRAETFIKNINNKKTDTEQAKGEVERAEANNTSEIELVQSKLKDKNAPEDQKPFWEDDLRDLKNNPKRYWDAFDLQSIKNTSDNKDRYEQIKFMQEYYGGDTNTSSTEQASQSRVKTLTNERIKPSVQKPKNPPKKLNTIINEVADKLKATLVYGKSKRRGTAGTYNSSNTLVKIRNAGDLDTVAHELGHLIDDRYDIVGNTKGHPNEIKLVKQLKWFSDRGGSNPPSGLNSKQKAEYLEREGLAEFIRAYIANPKETKVVAPELYKHFESSIDAKTKSALKEFSQDFLDFANATYGEQILSNVENSTLPGKNKFKDWIDQFKGEDGKLNIHWLDKVKSNWTNSMHIANKAFAFVQGLKGNDVKSLKPEENFEVMSRLLAGINGKINHVIGNGLVDAKNNVIKDSKGLTMNINYLLESLDNTSETTLKNEMDEVIKMLIAERTIEYVKKFGRTDNLTGIGGGIKTDLEVAQGHLNELDALKKENKEQYQRIKEAARRYREFADAGLKYAVEKGRISKEQYQRIKDTNEYYVSLARTKEVTPTDEILPFLNESSKISSVKEVIKKAKGGTDVIKNPYLSLLHNTVNFIKEADRNEVMLSFVEPLNEVRKMGDGTPIDLSQIARQVPSGEKNTIKVFKDGELQNWQFDQDIYDALKGIEGISHNKFIEVLGKPAELIRFTVTNFPVFALRNAFRDTMSRMVISRTRGKVSDLLHNKEDRQFFELYGGSQAGFYLTNKDAYAEEMNKAVKAITKKGGIILDPRKLNYTAYRKLLERGENLNRVAEYKSAYRKAKKQGMDDYNAGLYAAYQARDLMDFAVAGHYMRVVNKLVPFSNASVQSIKRSVKGAKEDPAKFALRMALFTVLPQLAFRAMVHANGDDEEYEELPDYQRDLFWNFKTPFTGNTWISLPKPFELGLPSSIIDRGISKANGNNEAFDGATMSSFKTLFPFDETALVGSLKPIIEASSNHDFFRDRDIVPFWEKDKIMALRDGTKYASRIGNALSDGFGFVGAEVDPRKIDHIIKGYTTYYGDWVLSLGDIGKEDSRYQFNVTKTGFAKDMPISNSKSVKKVYDLAKSIGADTNKNVKELKGMVKLYYDLEDKKAKKKLSKAIYKQARLLIPYLEAEKKMKLAKNKLKTTD